MRLLPLLKTSPQDANFLRHRCLLALFLSFCRLLCPGACGCLNRLLAEPCLTLAYVPQGGTGASLLGKGAVENDGFCAFELTQECGKPLFELVGWNPAGTFDVASYVV